MSVYHQFLNPTILPSSIDVAGIQQAILAALRKELPQIRGTVLDVGCGQMPYKSLVLAASGEPRKYIGMDLATSRYGVPDVVWDGMKMPFESEVIDAAIATEVLEHCPLPEIVLAETLRVLRPGGFLFLTVPFVWPLHCAPNDEYRYTPFSLHRHLANVGFEQIKLHSLGDWDASLATMIGLWTRRRRMNPLLRRIFSVCATPLVRCLWWSDNPRNVEQDQSMPVGMYGTAVRPA